MDRGQRKAGAQPRQRLGLDARRLLEFSPAVHKTMPNRLNSDVLLGQPRQDDLCHRSMAGCRDDLLLLDPMDIPAQAGFCPGPGGHIFCLARSDHFRPGIRRDTVDLETL